MSCIQHHAIIVTSWDHDYVKAARRKAVELFGDLVTEIRTARINDYYSFAILPDGSFEGWIESDRCDEDRNDFKRWIEEKFRSADGGCLIQWVEVGFGDLGLEVRSRA